METHYYTYIYTHTATIVDLLGFVMICTSISDDLLEFLIEYVMNCTNIYTYTHTRTYDEFLSQFYVELVIN